MPENGCSRGHRSPVMESCRRYLLLRAALSRWGDVQPGRDSVSCEVLLGLTCSEGFTWKLLQGSPCFNVRELGLYSLLHSIPHGHCEPRAGAAAPLSLKNSSGGVFSEPSIKAGNSSGSGPCLSHAGYFIVLKFSNHFPWIVCIWRKGV